MVGDGITRRPLTPKSAAGGWLLVKASDTAGLFSFPKYGDSVLRRKVSQEKKAGEKHGTFYDQTLEMTQCHFCWNFC